LNSSRRGQWKKAFLSALVAVIAFAASEPVRAQAKYPDRPVRIVVPFAAGGIADITVRVVADKLGDKLGQRFVVENVPGAGGIAAARAALSSPPDGHTLTLLTNGTAISVPLFKSLPFDPLKDFTPISTLGYFDFFFATNADSQFASLADVLKFAREQPGKLNVGTIAVGSSQNLSAELFKSTAGVNITIVPFRASPDVLVALLRNDVHVIIDGFVAMKSALGDRKIRAIASTGGSRSENLAAVPTVREAGVAGFEVTSWNGLFAPAGTPAEIVETLNRALREIAQLPDVKKRLLDLGIDSKASTPAELSGRLRADIDKWGKVIERAGIPKQ
jgi:tripartite-type tricarboxylate transporter receptor subunit TctC